MIDIKIFPFNAFLENTYVLSDETGECIIIDAGSYSQKERETLDEYIASNKLKPVLLVNTHGHVDHVLGSRHVVEKYKVKFLIHKDDINLLASAKEHGMAFGFDVQEPPLVSHYLEDGSELTFGKSKLKMFHVPGHSPGSIALYSEEGKFVIVGDVLFKGSIGRTDLPGGDYDVLMKSIMTKLMTLPDETIVYSGHGPKTTIHEEALSNPFLG